MENGLSVHGITKNLDGFKLDHVNFSLEPGQIMGMIGVNGSGKTSLIRYMIGLYRNILPEDSGAIQLCGYRQSDNTRAYKDRIAYVLKDSCFSEIEKVLEMGELHGRYYKNFSMKRYREWLARYGIPEKKVLGQLSQGEKIKQQLAFALSYDAVLYLFDEPAGNLDVDFRDTFYRLMRELVSDEKRMVIYATHLVDEIETVADQILWMDKKENTGRVRFFGSIDELRDNFRIVEASAEDLKMLPEGMIVGKRLTESHSEVMVDIRRGRLPETLNGRIRFADIREIMYFSLKRDGIEKGV